MNQDAASVVHDLGVLALLPGAMCAVTALVALLAGDSQLVLPLLASAGVLWIVGGYSAYRLRGARARHRWPAVEVVALGWLGCGLAGAWVFLLAAVVTPDVIGAEPFGDPLTAIFEGFSGITTTGMTMVAGHEAELAPTLQWWRSLLQWVGGGGMVLFAVALGHPTSGTKQLYEAEGRHVDLPGGVPGTVRRTAAIYGGLSGAAVGALLLAGEAPWIALNHGLTAIATGGFVADPSALAPGPVAVPMVLVAIMIAGSVSFAADHVLLVARDLRRWWHLTPVRGQAALLLLGGIPVAAVAWAGPAELGATVFHWISASTTGGFALEEVPASLPLPVTIAVIAVMVIGAPSGSTGGGIKIDRVLWIAKGLGHRWGRRPITWDGRPVGSSTAKDLYSHATVLVGLWLALLAVATLTLWLLAGRALLPALFDVTSAQSNVGLQTSAIDPGASAAEKIVLVAVMYLGRLELLVALFVGTQREPA